MVIVRGTERKSVGDGHEDTKLFETSSFSTVLWDEKSHKAMLKDKRTGKTGFHLSASNLLLTKRG